MDSFIITIYIALLGYWIIGVCSVEEKLDPFEEFTNTNTDSVKSASNKRPDDSVASASHKRTVSRPDAFGSSEVLPWTCGVEYFWRDLGDYHHPRHVREARCSNATCWFGHYSCIPNTYSVKVLTPNFVGHIDGKIPAQLRMDWRFQDVSITVGCQCGR